MTTLVAQSENDEALTGARRSRGLGSSGVVFGCRFQGSGVDEVRVKRRVSNSVLVLKIDDIIPVLETPFDERLSV